MGILSIPSVDKLVDKVLKYKSDEAQNCVIIGKILKISEGGAHYANL